MAIPKTALKLATGTCLIAIAAASTSPKFRANPMIGSTIGVIDGELRDTLPQALNHVGNALKGR